MSKTPFGDCKTAALHDINFVQAHGALIAVDTRTELICACSANTPAFTGRTPDELLGKNWSAVFSLEQIQSIRSAGAAAASGVVQFRRTVINDAPVVIASHTRNNVTQIEIEARDPDEKERGVEPSSYLCALAVTASLPAAARLLMEGIASVTRFDRVMLYKFLPDWHGEVIAETLRPGVDGFLGLRFPAEDLPANARRLYLLNWKRAINDVDAPTYPILTAPGSQVPDLTYSQLRAVHPVHIQYLKNIGAAASFSVSIIVGEKLWGLVACHNLTAKHVALPQQQLCEQLARMTSMHMSDMRAAEIEKTRASYREALAAVEGALTSSGSDPRVLRTQAPQLLKMFKARGMWARLSGSEGLGGEDYYEGRVPGEGALALLKQALAGCDRRSVTAWRRANPTLPGFADWARFASGVLYIPLSGADFLALMRPEQIETVVWAGRPQDLQDSSDVVRELTPRASFDRWRQEVRGVSEPWLDEDIEAATRLRETLLQHFEARRIEGLALHDPLTGLSNRRMFEKALEDATQAVGKMSPFAVHVLDLDKFKPVNDAMGHAAGDELLVAVSQRLKACVREGDVVARLGGDEFAIIQFQLSDANNASLAAGRIVTEIQRPFTILGQSVEIGVSIGVALYPVHGKTISELTERADLALYRAKRSGRNCFKVFDTGMLSEKEQKEAVRVSLVEALEQEEFLFIYQPIVSAATWELQSFEAFACWRHPEQGTVSAASFMPLLEQYQLSLSYAQRAIGKLVRQQLEWREKGLPPVPVSLNIWAPQFLSLDIVGLCSALSGENGLGLDWLRFDLEEKALQSDFQRCAEKIERLAALGVLTNIDHFGEGAVSLANLVRLKLNKVKVRGRMFAADARSEGNEALISVIRAVARALRAQVVATQIENPAMEAKAREAGVDVLQGYWISRGLQTQDMEEFLRVQLRAGWPSRAA